MQGLLILVVCIVIPTLCFLFMMYNSSRRTKTETDSSDESSGSEDECLNDINDTTIFPLNKQKEGKSKKNTSQRGEGSSSTILDVRKER